MKIFEEWAAEHGIGKESYGYEELRECWTAAQYALNSELGIAANEAAKDARRKVAVDAINAALTGTASDAEWLDAIIREAQG